QQLGIPSSNKLYFCSLSDLPDQIFIVSDNGSVVELSPEAEELARKANLYSSRVRMEIKGQFFECGDFTVHIFSCMMGSTLKNIAIEVGYGPFLRIGDGMSMIRQFMEGIEEADNFQPIPQYSDDALNQTFSLKERISQYQALFSKLL
ncbi:unnamed protein product, partial [Heterosigma akashiwo]